jgi:Family of unknown function (DUF6521)
MRPWEDRPAEVANLLNPAFCGWIIFQCVQSNIDESEGSPMPYALAFLVLPLVLHQSTRETMKSTTRHFQVWLNGNQQIKIGLAERARSLVPYTREALMLLQQTHTVAVRSSDAALVIQNRLRRIRQRRFSQSEETKECLKKSETLGKWFARANSPATIYASLGLMP